MSPLLPPWLFGVAVLVVVALYGLTWAWVQARPGRPPRHLDVLALAVIGALVAAFFWRALLTADVYMPNGGGDLASFFYPLYTFIHRSVHETGQLPLWNPYAFSGAPLAADVQSGLWYPPNWVVWFLLPPPNFGGDFVVALHSGYGVIEWQLIAHYAWAALGMYLWLRALRLLRVAAVAGTAAFAFCGFMAAHFGHMPMIFAAAWLPWNLLLTRRLVLGRGWGATLLLGVTLGLTFLAGHPQTFLYELLAVALYWAWLTFAPTALTPAPLPAGEGNDGTALTPTPLPAGEGNEAPPRFLRPLFARYAIRNTHYALLTRVVQVAVALAIAAGLGMVQYLPSAELAGQSIRSAISWEEAGANALQPVGLLGLVLPRIFGSNPTNYWVPWQDTENWGYLGIVALLLAGLALALRRDRVTGFALTLGGLALLLSLGPSTQLFAWLHGLVPGFNRLRGAGRFLLEIGLATGLLAGLGLDAVLRLLGGVGGGGLGVSTVGGGDQGSEITIDAPGQQIPDARLQPPTPNPPVLAEDAALVWKRVLWGLLAGVAVLVGFVAPLFNALFLSGSSMDRAAMVLNDLNIGILWVGIVTGLLWLAHRRRLAAGTLGLALTVLLVADLFAPNAAFNPTTTDLTLGYQNPDQIGLLYNKTGAHFRIDSDTGGVITRWQPSTGVLMEIPDAGGLYNPLTLQRYDRVWTAIKANVNDPWLDLLNIRFLVAAYADRPTGPKFRELDSNAQDVHVYENANVMPRAFVVHDAAVVPDPEQQFAQIDGLKADPRHTVLLPGGTAAPSATKGSAEGNADDQANVTSATPNQITVQVKNAQPGWLVLSEVWYPGWVATLDGQRVDIVQADYLLRGVQLGPGQHILTLDFRSRSLLIGQILSGITALIVLLAGAALALGWWRRRQAH